MKKIYTESIIVDSGAHSLYNVHVLKLEKRVGKHGRELDRPQVRWGQGDFSFYDLRRGSPFRRYCDDYAKFIRAMRGRVLCVTVDAIGNPDLTWEIQRFFEEEHGVQPVPVVHYGTPMRYVDRYLEAGRYDLLGVGGLGQGVTRHEYVGWGDEFFEHICPPPKRLPVIRTHGFAMTSWELMCRWPWWSVDSATWVKLAAYGWVLVPRWLGDRWDFLSPPFVVNFSWRSPRLSERQKHFFNVPPSMQEVALRWLRHLGLDLGEVDENGEVKVFGVMSHHRARSIANLHCLKGLESALPPWPWPLREEIISSRAWYRRGLGL